uniref:Uncharacterized protein n=1 Tax=Rhizophora mucronata TaxID=61149 RepID=A0A2P2QK02_RHIMU
MTLRSDKRQIPLAKEFQCVKIPTQKT